MQSELPAPRPVLKWAGGKSQLVVDISRRLPLEIDTYYEPFVGGAAVFFALAAEKRFRRAVLSDRNEDLVELYQALKTDVEAVIQALGAYKYDEAEYYQVREQKPRKPALRAARLIFLNKTGYNGLYRVNRSGQFNVPFGRHKAPNFKDESNLRAAAAALKHASIEVADFEEICKRAGKRDAVYLDPPYLPLSSTSNFTAYDRLAFDVANHERLAAAFARLSKRGVPAVLSNSDTPLSRTLYAAFEVETVRATRAINSNAAKRGAVKEILVSTPACPQVGQKRKRTTARSAREP